MERLPTAGKEAKGARAGKEAKGAGATAHRVPHSLDVMHITKNVCESVLGTLLNMPERTKDGPKARADLKSMGIRESFTLMMIMMRRSGARKVVAKAKRPRRPELTTLPRALL